jgi:hypothetical protein
MELKLTYDAGIDAWTMAHRSVHLATDSDVAQWQRLVLTELDKLKGKQVYLLVDVSDFEVSASQMQEYGQFIKKMGHNFHAVFRYGAGEKTQRAVLLQSMVNRYAPNLFPDRDSAVRALGELRAKGETRSRPRGR